MFVFVAGFYQNLGDLAITYAQIEFLRNTYYDSEVIAVPAEDTFYAIPMIKKYISKSDIITLIGGGNMSDMYHSLETVRREVVRRFPEICIISFPQTAYFSNSKKGRKELRMSRCIYTRHTNLYLFARESASYSRMCEYFPDCSISIAPDIVMTLDLTEPVKIRDGLLVCLRSDKEQLLSVDLKMNLIEAVKKVFHKVVITDTTDVELDSCQPGTYESTLDDFISKIKTASVVLTDRLHGMIFCAITCIVIDNSNHKVTAFYETWLKGCESIQVLSALDVEGVVAALNEFKDIKNMNSITKELNTEFSSLRLACANSI